jgi:hypothetical protein
MALAAVIQKHFPDWRRVLNELQRYSATGAIDTGILTNFQDSTIRDLLKACKEKRFDDIRKWVHENNDVDSIVIFRSIYEMAGEIVSKRCIPLLIKLIAEYQYKDAFVADKEINILAFLVDVMLEVEFL